MKLDPHFEWIFKTKKNEARKIMGEAQQKSWKKFVESFNVNTSIKDMWSNYRKYKEKVIIHTLNK